MTLKGCGIVPKNIVKLTETEQAIWHYLSAHKETISDLSLSQISEHVHASTATIVRTVQKRGFEGFSDYKYKLKHSKPSQLDFSHVETRIQKLILKNEQEIMATLNQLDVNILHQATELIHEAQRIFLIAGGVSALITEEMQLKLQIFEKNTFHYKEADTVGHAIRHFKAGDLVIGVSMSGLNRDLERCVEVVRAVGGHSIILSSNPDSPMCQTSDVSIIGVKDLSSAMAFHFDMHSRLSIAMIARILIDIYTFEWMMD